MQQNFLKCLAEMELATIIKSSTSQEVLLAVLIIIIFTILQWCCHKRNRDPVEETVREKGKMAVGKTNYEQEENSEN